MADQKITQLTELSAQPASTDVLPIVDIDDTTMAGSGTTKKISVTNLLASKADSTHTHAIGDITGTVPTSQGGTNLTAIGTALQTLRVNAGATALEFADNSAQLTTEEVQDIVGGMFSGNTETRITATYEDGDGTIDLAVDDMTADTQLTTEAVQDIVGGMVGSNTETNIAVTYDDTNGKLDFVSTDTNTQLSTEAVQDIVGAMVSSNTETNIAVTYDDTNGKLDFVSTDTNTQLTTEAVQDIIGAMFSANTETRIAVTYDDSDGTIDLVVDDMSGGAGTTYTTSVVDSSDDAIIRLTGSDSSTDDVKLVAGGNITLTPSGDDITIAATDTNTQLSTEEVQDIVGAMFTGNTETNTAVTYEDSDGTIDVVTTLDGAPLTTEAVQDIVGGMFSGNTETRVSATYEDGDGTIDLVVDDMTANTMGSGFTVAATTTGTGTTITQGDSLTLAAGTGITTTGTSDGVVTIAATGGGGGVTSITPAADTGSGTAITSIGTLTNTGGTGIDTSVSGTTTTFDLDINELTDLTNTTFGNDNFGAGDHIAVADASDSNNPKRVKFPVELGMAVSDETTDLTTGTAKLTFRMPHAMTLTEVRANVNTAPTGSYIQVDINASASASSIFSTVLTIDISEKTSKTAAVPAVLSTTALADDAEFTVDIDIVGSSAAGKGLKIWLKGYR